MKNQIVYKIINLTDKDGNHKEHLESLDTLYYIHSASINRTALLVHLDDDRHIRTSTVYDIYIYNNNFVLTTRNSIYTLAPVTL